MSLNATLDQDESQYSPNFIQFTDKWVEILSDNIYDSSLTFFKSILTATSEYYFQSTALANSVLCLKHFGDFMF